MNTYQGFSLIEVLVSMLLLTSISIGLLQQQWQASHLFNQIKMRAQAVGYLDNNSEQWLTGATLSLSKSIFQFKKIPGQGHILLQINWNSPDLLQQTLQRQLSF